MCVLVWETLSLDMAPPELNHEFLVPEFYRMGIWVYQVEPSSNQEYLG